MPIPSFRSARALAAVVFALGLPLAVEGLARSLASFPMPDFGSCNPSSEYVQDVSVSPVNKDITYSFDLGFCSDWNPEFSNNSFRCCGRYVVTRKRKANLCAPHRRKATFCEEMTEDQKLYTALVESGAVDPLALIQDEMGRSGAQSYCSVNNGFLAYGRRVIPTSKNRIQLRSPDRCVDFGTDGMTGMLEWTGRQIDKSYSAPELKGVRLTIGDVSAPRGGCLTGRGGRRGHASHTNGKDVDIGYLTVAPSKPSPVQFHTKFDARQNWWLLKQIFKNPYACVKVVFLDKKNIRALERVARADEEWSTLWRFIRHMPHHKNHMHVRVGDHPGLPGCVPGARPELEEGEEINETEDAVAGDSDQDIEGDEGGDGGDADTESGSLPTENL